ncbi:MAG: hypothetical protein AAF542_25805 [Pseudomonadota bacterium]
MLLQKFKEGLAWGSGFAIVFFGIGYLVFGVLMSVRFSPGDTVDWDILDSSAEIGPNSVSLSKPFFEYSIDEQIAMSSVIMLVSYEEQPDSSFRARIDEILKESDGSNFQYSEGDEYSAMNMYPEKQTYHGEGAIVFFIGTPPRQKASASYSGDRIMTLGNIPISKLREKIDPSADA